MAVSRRRTRIAELLQDVPETEVKALACRAALRRLVVEFDFFDSAFHETQSSTLMIMMVGRQAVALTLNAKFSDGYIEGRTADPFLSMTLETFKQAKIPQEKANFGAYFINAVFDAMEENRDLDESKLIADCLPRSEKVDGWNFDTALHEVERDVSDVRVASTPFSVLTKPLFREAVRPEFRTFVSNMTDPRLDFFRRWFERVEMGQPLEWELQRRVAMIPEQVWQTGADAIAKAISETEEAWRAERLSNRPRSPEFEPNQVKHLFDNRTLVSAGAASLSATIRMEFERFRAETGLNQTPDLFAPLEALPPVLDRIAEILRNEKRTDTTEQILREEVGRLNARVAELENALADARSECAKLHSQSWKKVAAWTVGSTNLFGVLAAAVWTVSGDDVGARKRLETLLEYRTVFDEVSSGKSTAPTP